MSDAEELASARLQLQQVTDERDALRHELDARSEEFRLAADQELKTHGGFVINVWLKCLGGKCAQKDHLIDGLAITTRRLVASNQETLTVLTREIEKGEAKCEKL